MTICAFLSDALILISWHGLTEKPFVWITKFLFKAILWYRATIDECEEWSDACCWKKSGKIRCSRSLWVHINREKVVSFLYQCFMEHGTKVSHFMPFSVFCLLPDLILSCHFLSREQKPQDFLDCIIDLREYDVPYHVRFAIDNGNF